jgi:small subunit ribosomal protein S16
MLVIRMQRRGRKGSPTYRIVVQDSRVTPTSGKVVASLGHYNPHTKAVELNKEAAAKYVSNGAQPSPRVAAMLKREGVALPDWVKMHTPKTGAIRNPDKLRRNQPKEEVVGTPVVVEAVVPAAEVAEVDDPSQNS